MPREAKLFVSSAGSAVRGYLKFRANIPPRWIRNARTLRKRMEPEVDSAFRSFMRLPKSTNGADANAELEKWRTPIVVLMLPEVGRIYEPLQAA